MASWELQEQQFMDKVLTKYQYIRLWMTGIGPRRMFTFIVMHPTLVQDREHRVVHDLELREEARVLIPAGRTNVSGDNAVLAIVPLY